MHLLINDEIEAIESKISKLSSQLREYIYLSETYDSEIIHIIADKLKLNVNKLLEITDQSNKD